MRFARTFSFTLKNTIRDKSFVFWTIMYPIILSTFMYMAFSGLLQPKSISFKVGIGPGSQLASVFQEVDVFQVAEYEPDQAEKALHDKAIDAYITEDMNVQVVASGIAQSTIEGFVGTFKQISYLYENGTNPNPNFADFQTEFILENKQEVSVIAVYLYSILGMVSFYGLFSVFHILESIQANISDLGKRMAASPIRKGQYIISSLLVMFCLNFLSNLILIFYFEYILKIHLFSDYPRSLLLLALGNLGGISLGMVIGVRTWSAQLKQALGIGLTMFMAFLSGMMSVGIKALIMKYLPIADKINPIAIVTSSLYRLNLLAGDNYYWSGIIILASFSLVLIGLSIISLRRRTYDSL